MKGGRRESAGIRLWHPAFEGPSIQSGYANMGCFAFCPIASGMATAAHRPLLKMSA